MKLFIIIFKFLFYIMVTGAIFSVLAITTVYFYIEPNLPSIKNAQSYRLDTPLKVYSKDNKLIAEFGESKREPLSSEQIPEQMKQAIIAAEDGRFYEHPGVDYQGIIRAVVNLATTGKKGQGGSTITMQVARNFFLTRNKTYIRKIREIFLALKLERHFSKEKILELYLNKIFLGHRSYGIATAAKTYYGKPLNELALYQFAMLAGLPKAPSKYNPVTNSERSTIRRNYILRRMFELNYISKQDLIKTKAIVDDATLHTPIIELNAPYVAEMARSWMMHKSEFKDDIYTGGYKLYTSIDSKLQQTAIDSLRQTLMEYEHRHGFKGAVKQIEITDNIFDKQSNTLSVDNKTKLLEQLKTVRPYGHLETAIVLSIDENTNPVKNKKKQSKIVSNAYATILLANGEIAQLPWKGISWAKKYISDTRYTKPPKTIAKVLSIGDIVYVEKVYVEKNQFYQLAQFPEVAGAIVSVKPRTGQIIALTGGFDFYQSKFNRIMQAERQPGSNFKPFIYSAALNKGYTTASLINDAPVIFKDKNLEDSWRPSNYSGKFFGPTRLRKALYKSRNMVSIRLLMAIGVNYALDYVKKFGFDSEKLPHNLSLSLGSANLTPIKIIQGYSSFANGGYNIEPWIIEKVSNSKNEVLYQHTPMVACSKYYAKDLCPQNEEQHALQTIASDNVFLMTSILQDVIKRGTGRKALSLKRNDLAGKTGTTNDQLDAWFSGFNRDIATTTWVGFDTPRSLGRYETGGKAALPMWIRYMRVALKDIPDKKQPIPKNIIFVKIDAQTGLLATTKSKHHMFEYFIKGSEPQEVSSTNEAIQETINEVEEELF